MKILVVDDNQVNLMIAKELLEEHVNTDGILLCNIPETVMNVLATEDVGVVLLDIIMPKLDGISLLKQIRTKAEYKDMQIVMYTGVSDKGSFRQCFENGANDYINKPIEPTEFVVRMRAAIKARLNLLELRKTQAYLVQSEKLASIGALAAGFAHEINNPIGFVSSNLEMLAKYLEKVRAVIEKYRELGRIIHDLDTSREELSLVQQQISKFEKEIFLDRILKDFAPIIDESREGVDRVAILVKILRNFAGTDKEETVTQVDMNQVAEEALLFMKREVKDVAVIKKNLRQVVAVKCDQEQIVTVLINILNNADQAIKGQSRKKPGTIRIDTYMEEEYTVCRIYDDGPGIKPEHLQRIFDPFFTTKEVGSGMGLGLSISFAIVKKYSGELLVESEPGVGTTFFVKLPVAKLISDYATVEGN